LHKADIEFSGYRPKADVQIYSKLRNPSTSVITISLPLTSMSPALFNLSMTRERVSGVMLSIDAIVNLLAGSNNRPGLGESALICNK